MVKGNEQTTNTAIEMKEMRTLIEKLFGELNTRQDKFDQAISELKESIQSSKAQDKAGEGAESAINSSSVLLQEENAKTLTGRGPTEKQIKGDSAKCSTKKKVYLSENDSKYVVDVPTVDVVKPDMHVSLDAVVEYDKPYEGACVTGYHGKRPLSILIGLGGTTHNFIDESLADELGCQSFSIKPRTVGTFFGHMVTSRACKNFQLTLQGAQFSLDLYLLPMSSNCDMVFGGEWERMLDKVTFDCKGVEFYFQGKKHAIPFNKLADEGSNH